MSSPAFAFNANLITQEIEPILVTYYRSETGTSPTLYEFKQFIVSQAADKLIDALKKSDSSVLKSMPTKEILSAINIYTRKLRVS